jgi:hypothetical protein
MRTSAIDLKKSVFVDLYLFTIIRRNLFVLVFSCSINFDDIFRDFLISKKMNLNVVLCLTQRYISL